MRSVAIGLLVLSFGCNQIFGIRETIQRDAAPASDGQPDALWPGLIVTRQVLKSVGPEVIEFPPIAGVAVEYGDLGSPLKAVTPDSEGKFLIPAELALEYRLMIRIPGEVPTEIHWKKHGGHLIFDPAYGRLPQTPPPPSNSGLRFLQGPNITNPQVITTGRWTETAIGPQTSPFQFLYSSTAISLDGPLATLEGAQGDTEILIDADPNGSATAYLVGSIAGLLAPGSYYPVTPAVWKTTATSPAATMSRIFSDDATTANPTYLRLISPQVLGAGGPLNGGHFQPAAANKPHYGFGVIPSSNMPNFINQKDGLLDEPMFLDLSMDSSNNPINYANPFKGVDAPLLPAAAFRRTFDYRVVDTVQLTSGFQVVFPLTDVAGTTATTSATIEYGVGIARNVSLGGTPLTNVPSEPRSVALGGQATIGLMFDADGPIDDCVVTLYQLDPGTLTAVHRFMMLETPQSAAFQIASNLLQPGKTYALKLACRKGFPGLSTMGDYTTVQYPFSISTLFPSTFTVTP